MATAAEVRWMHYSPEHRMGHYKPARGADGHMQYVPRAPGDGARLAPDELERMIQNYTRLDHSRGTHVQADSMMYKERDPKELEAMFDKLRTTTRNEAGAPGEFTRAVNLGSGHVQHADPSMLDAHHKAKNRPPMPNKDGYFGEAFLHIRAAVETPRMLGLRNMVLDGVHKSDGTYRSIRDLVSQLWFDDGDEATAGAQGLADLTVPSNPHAPANREIIGATPTVMEGLERLLRAGNPNSAYHACEALSQLAFRNNRNGQRIMTTFAPHMRTSLGDLLGFDHPQMDHESQHELRGAVLRVLNNCAWNSRQACVEIAEDSRLMDAVEDILTEGAAMAHTSPAPVPLLMSLDAAVGLLSHLSANEYSKDVLLRRRVGENVLMPMVVTAEEITDPPEQYLCTIAGAVEVIIKLIWDAENPPFIPHSTVLQTIVWTLVCSLDGVMWAGITWSSLGRVQTLSKLASLNVLKIQLIDLNTVEALVRLLNQWTCEQGLVVLEEALMCLLHLLTFEEGRFRMYIAGVYRPFRSIVLGNEGASDLARERAVLCSWMLFEWQVAKLEDLDRRTKELMRTLEDSERARLEVENEFARERASWLLEIQQVRSDRDALREQYEALTSELDGTSRALVREQAMRAEEQERIKQLEGEVWERDATIDKLQAEKAGLEGEVDHWRRRALEAEAQAMLERCEQERFKEERDKAVSYAEVRFEELKIADADRARAETERDAHKTEAEATGRARNVAERAREAAEAQLAKRERECLEEIERAKVNAERLIHDEERRGLESRQLLARLYSRHKIACGIVNALRHEHEELLRASGGCSCGACRKDRVSVAGAWGGDEEEMAMRRSVPEGVYAVVRGWDRKAKALKLASTRRPVSAPVNDDWIFSKAEGPVDLRFSRRTRGVGGFWGASDRLSGMWQLGGADEELPRDVRGLIDSWRKTLPKEEAESLQKEIADAPPPPGVRLSAGRYMMA